MTRTLFIRLFLLVGLLASSLFGLTACSTLTELRQDFANKVFGREPANPPAELEEIQPSYIAKIDWSSDAGKTNQFDYTPALDDSAAYVANVVGEISKLDVATGRPLWKANVGEPISGGVGIGAGIVLVGSSKGNIFAYDISGKQVWKAKLSSEILSVPRYFDGVVIARSGDNRIYGLDATDGSRKWVYERINPALTLRSSVGVVVDSGAVYAGFAGGKMVAIRADNGKLIWEATVAQPRGVTEIERIADITSLPVVDGALVYAVAYQGKIAAVDRRSGKVVWNRDISSYSGMNVQDNKVFVTHTLGAVYSLDYETGKTFWRQGALSNRRLTAPLPMGNVIAVGDLEGYVHFLTRDEGKFAARIQLDSNPVMSLITGSKANQIIAETRGGGLYAISLAETNTPAAALDEASQKEPSKKEPSEKATSEKATEASEKIEEKIDAIINEKLPLSTETTPTDTGLSSDSQPSAPAEERSILFQKNDSILLPDSNNQDSGGPGIRLPSQAQ